MAFLVGVDEAGYGPNLGPLLIAASVWEVPEQHLRTNLYELTTDIICADSPVPGEHWWVADSKRVYHAGAGLELLEQHMLVGAHLAGAPCRTWRELWQLLAADPSDSLDSVPWHDGKDLDLPRAACLDSVCRLAQRVSKRLNRLQVRLVAIRAVAIFPGQFNDLVELHGNKSTVLSRLSLALVAEVLANQAPHSSVIVSCDKHGGRNRYGELLQLTFPEYLVEVYDECTAESIYRWGPRDRRIECRFCAQGESFLPSALASMTAKYLRELSMEVFNQFWRSHLPELEPTAGYPGDARRFHREIQGLQQELGISDGKLWRCR